MANVERSGHEWLKSDESKQGADSTQLAAHQRPQRKALRCFGLPLAMEMCGLEVAGQAHSVLAANPPLPRLSVLAKLTPTVVILPRSAGSLFFRGNRGVTCVGQRAGRRG